MSQSPDEPISNTESDTDYEQGWQELSRLVDQGRSFSGREPHCCFLNLGNGQFADASAVSGLNSIDDGRGIAVVDWDADGDLDLWVTNRTAPAVRFFRNDFRQSNRFVSLKLVGTECNRDAIGARVELILNDDSSDEPDRDSPQTRFVKSVYAGRGFLSQSSKRIHFGLSRLQTVNSVSVRWPGGSVENFTGIETGHQHRLVQGTGRADRLPDRVVPRGRATPGQKPETPANARTVLYHRPKLPDLNAVDFNGEPLDQKLTSGRPLMVSFWATWCQPCLQELQDWTGNESEVVRHNLQILAINVEDTSRAVDTPGQPARLLERMNFPFAAGTTDRQFLDGFAAAERHLFGRIRPLSIPTSLLVDSQGQIAVVYRGSVRLQQVIDDLQLLDARAPELRNNAAAFPGRWVVQVVDIREHPLAASDLLDALLEQPFRVAIVTMLLLGSTILTFVRVWRCIRRHNPSEPDASNVD